MDQIPGALWGQDELDEHRVNVAPELIRVVIGVDPSGTNSSGSDECGIVGAGLGADGRYYVLADRSAVASPEGWAKRTVLVYDDLSADRVIAEKNFGGDMVESTLKTERATLPIRLVTASRGKAVRAEPIAALHTQGKVSFVGRFPDLEDQCCGWTPGSGWSPDRMDAYVWAMTELVNGSGLISHLNSMSNICPKCALANLKSALECFKCHAPLAEEEGAA
jgi:phage terminase large subunit-like protein